MSNKKKRTIREIYNSNDLSEIVLNLPLTPYSEEFVSYKNKLDSAVCDLKVLVSEQIFGEKGGNLEVILNKIRENIFMSCEDVKCGQIGIEIRNDKYFCIYLEIIELENSISDIIECFIKWKNDHYYTMWDDLSIPPQELRDLWVKFRNKISGIITSCKKISSQPLPRMLIGDKIKTVEDEKVDIKDDKVGNKENSDQVNKNNSDNTISNGKLDLENINSIQEKSINSKRDRSKKGSAGFWGPKTVPKSKNRYISGISKVRSVSKRIYNSNGRYKNIKNKNVSEIIMNMEKGLSSESLEKIEIRNLKKWERIEEKRHELKCKKYLLKPKGSNEDNSDNGLIFKGDIDNPSLWSSNFSKCFKVVERNKCNGQTDVDSDDLFEMIRSEVNKIDDISNEIKEDGLITYKKLCNNFLEKYFGYCNFREGQFEAISSVLLHIEKDRTHKTTQYSRNGSILILPTGHGKSLCYQYLSIIINRWYKKVTIVLTPLISLMQDQLRNLNENVRGAIWNSNVSFVEKKYITELIIKGELDILFITPESIFSSYLSRGLIKQGEDGKELGLENNNIGLLCIDEAHCVSEWGSSFRPCYYSSISYLVNRYKVGNLMGITATATKDVLIELKHLLKLNNVIQPFSNQNIQRSNLICKIIHLNLLKKRNHVVSNIKDINGNIVTSAEIPRQYNNFTLVWDYVKYSVMNKKLNNGEKKAETKNNNTRREIWSNCKNILIYVWQRSDVESVTDFLRAKGANALYYHGMMSSNERELVQKSFMENKTNIFVATSSFGMGIDKKDIDAVIHWNMPNSLEQYIQETGRCARKLDKKGYCLLILSDEDYKLKRQIISSSLPDKASLRCFLCTLLYNFDLLNSQIIQPKEGFVEYDIFSIELLKIILNTKNNEYIEIIMHILKPYMEFILNELYITDNFLKWEYYIRGSPYIKIRCFEENFDHIKEENEFFGSLFPFCTEKSGVITIDLPEASKSMGLTIEYLEEEIDSLRSVYKITVERENNKRCVITTFGSGGRESNPKDDDLPNLNSRQKYMNIFMDANSKLRSNWKDLLVNEILKELHTRNLSELWKLDIAYISFQKFACEKETKELVFDCYFNNKRVELYNELLINKPSESFLSLGISKSHSFLKKICTTSDINKDVHVKLEEEEMEFCDLIENELWFNKWNEEFGHTLVCKEVSDTFNSEIRREITEKTKSCIRAGVSYLISSHFSDYLTVQWETYRISLEKVIEYFNDKKHGTNRRNNKLTFQKEVCETSDNDDVLFKQYSNGPTADKFNLLFPGDIAKILVGVNSFRFCNKSGGSKISGFKGKEITASKFWGKFRNIPYNLVLRICEEKFREMAAERFTR